MFEEEEDGPLVGMTWPNLIVRTCEWIVDERIKTSVASLWEMVWRLCDASLYWINGNAGCGKNAAQWDFCRAMSALLKR